MQRDSKNAPSEGLEKDEYNRGYRDGCRYMEELIDEPESELLEEQQKGK